MERSVLDVYVLALLDRGCQTPYDLHRDGKLSLGAILPSLNRLSKQKLVRRLDDVGATRRPRHRYTLTPSGEKELHSSRKHLLDSRITSSDLDSLLRVVDLAIAYRVP